jgi:hypothetical protein
MRTLIAVALIATAGALAVSPSAIGTPPPSDPTASAPPSPSMAPPSPYPSPVVSGPGAQAVNCATIPRYGSGILPPDAGGEFVPYGVDAVTRCDTPLSTLSPVPTAAPPEVLTKDVASFVEVLNSLPPPAPDQACLRVAFPTQLSFVITFAPETKRGPLVMVVDRNCAALVITDTMSSTMSSRVRSYATLDPMRIFEQLYAAQPVTP